MKKENLIKELKEINVNNWEKTTEEIYNDIYNLVIDYENDTQDFNLDYIIQDYIDYTTAEEIAKQELENGGLIRLYYFLGNANLNNDIFKIDGYGNLEVVYRDDLQTLIDEILEALENE